MKRLVKRQGFLVPADLEKAPQHPVESKERFYNGIIIRLMKGLLKAQGITVTVEGAENIPTSGGALLAINHTGYYDFILGAVAAHVRGKRLVRFMAKKEIFDVSAVGAVMTRMDHISVDRAKGADSLSEAVERLNHGQVVGIFPEATISRSFEIKDLKTGAARIAQSAGVPLVPMVIWGSQRILTKDLEKNLGRSHTPITIRLGAPVDTGGTPEEVTARLHARMVELLDAVRTEYDGLHGPFPDGEPWRPVSMGGSAPTLERAALIDLAEKERRAAKKAEKQEKKEQDESTGGSRLAIVRRASRGLGRTLKKLVNKVTRR